MPFLLKLLFPEACFVFYADFCFPDRFEDEFDSSLCEFHFSAYKEDVWALHIADFLLSYYFTHKNWNHCLKYGQTCRFVKMLFHKHYIIVEVACSGYWAPAAIKVALQTSNHFSL